MNEQKDFLSKVPVEWYDIKDCWMVASKIVALMNERNPEPLGLNAYFFYREMAGNVYPSGLRGIVRKNISVVEERETIPEVEREYEFIKRFIGMKCEGSACCREEAMEYAKTIISEGSGCVLWIDTYYAKWNEMYNKIHFPHCVVLLDISENKSKIIDTFNRETPCFEVDNCNLYEMTNFVNKFSVDESFEAFIDKSEMVKVFREEFIIKYDAILEYIDNLKHFKKDFIEAASNIEKDVEDENTIKLLMRMFVNLYQKGVEQLEILRAVENLGLEMIQICEDVNQLWRLCAGIFAKICYLNKEKRIIKYNCLCEHIEDAIKKLAIFDKLLKEER